MPDIDNAQHLRLFSSDGTVTAVSSPVRNSILFLIRDEGEVSFSRIMEYTGLSKSTVSVHVNSLIDSGLIASRSVPGDARKKMYYLTASHLADIQPCRQTGNNEFRELIRQCYIKYDNVDYRQIIPHIIQVALIEAGIRIDPIMLRGGEMLGESVSVYLVAETLEKTIKNVIKFWVRYGAWGYAHPFHVAAAAGDLQMLRVHGAAEDGTRLLCYFTRGSDGDFLGIL
ncbi:MAG TPA: winged helix-turn-helix domain-containing protein [Methanocorpusculum sp.]|nr:winged helix-turn-helix domain-containing protein [Methanocorpusculum sp.]